MQLVFDTEQEDLRRAVRRLLENEVPPSKVRTLMETPDAHDPALWHRMATELGLQGLLVPEEHGGSGAGFVELAVVAEEMGRAVLPGPFLSTAVLAVSAVLDAGDDEAAKDLLPGIADGATTATPPVTEGGGRRQLEGATASATTTRKG